ncbi:MAG: hypothetical protein ACTSX2_04415 [Candidatus Thorarchaeota archaeon]
MNVYSNPSDSRFVLTVIAIAFIFGYGLGIIGFLLKSGSYLVLGVMWAIGTVLILSVWFREYYRRPISIQIDDDEIILHFRYREQKNVKWGEIGGVIADSSHHGSFYQRGGGLLVDGKNPYMITREIAESIIEGYRKEFGKHPPELDYRGKAKE